MDENKYAMRNKIIKERPIRQGITGKPNEIQYQEKMRIKNIKYQYYYIALIHLVH